MNKNDSEDISMNYFKGKQFQKDVMVLLQSFPTIFRLYNPNAGEHLGKPAGEEQKNGNIFY